MQAADMQTGTPKVVSLQLEDSFQAKAIRVNQKRCITVIPIVLSYCRLPVALPHDKSRLRGTRRRASDSELD
jgi:hypothetical protein